ncbi:hypothetical protein [Ornithinimicrobium faecis]|uniref:hypothetical protein n=1 Tax=Ornithinimicrobium faecis TaxID=2934158 RepID=UPI0021174229|nr:hypothetical protein [Ornithinimicrobium sp. HY1745]
MTSVLPMSAMMEPVHGFDLHSFAVLLHILLLTYWLGSDLGVFYASRFITDQKIPLAGRNVATKIMHVVDMAPRVCLVLFLPSGVTLMALDPLGRDIFYGWPLILIWLASLVWLAMVILDYRKKPERFAPLVSRADFYVRIALVVGLLATSIYALIATEPFGVTTNPDWLAGKVAAYALCIFGGLMIRVKLRPFTVAFGRLQSEGSTPEIEKALHAGLRGTIPYVLFIWVMVFVAAFLGVVKPGSTAF